jgi:alanyl-tRNA synthetase
VSFEAEVAEIHEASREGGVSLWQIGLSYTEFRAGTEFHAGDTGRLVATARSGAELEVPVLFVETDAAGMVWHFVRKPLLAGTRVRGEVL